MKHATAIAVGVTLTLVAGLVLYLDAQYPQNSLTYTDPYLRAQVQWFEKFGDYELAPVLTFGVFRNRVLMRFLGKPCDEQQVA